MHIHLWLPWAVAVALVLPAVFATSLRRTEQQSLHGDWLATTWSPAVVALVVALALTVDHQHVTSDELQEAVSKAADELDGSPYVSSSRLEVAVSDRLGRDVEVESIDTGDEDNADAAYEVRLSEGSDPVSCVEVTEDVDRTAGPYTSITSDDGPCDTDG